MVLVRLRATQLYAYPMSYFVPCAPYVYLLIVKYDAFDNVPISVRIRLIICMFVGLQNTCSEWDICVNS